MCEAREVSFGKMVEFKFHVGKVAFTQYQLTTVLKDSIPSFLLSLLTFQKKPEIAFLCFTFKFSVTK
jgi:hypothetical protein